MNGILCYLAYFLNYAAYAYTIVMIVYALASWFPGLRGRWLYYLAIIVEPVLAPVRRIIPPIGGFDLAFLVVLLLLQYLVRPMINSMLFNSCAV
ncbi:MAG: YggT family protein [Candidatus Tumulicola sp.]